jgi:hypothetical protein
MATSNLLACSLPVQAGLLDKISHAGLQVMNTSELYRIGLVGSAQRICFPLCLPDGSFDYPLFLCGIVLAHFLPIVFDGLVTHVVQGFVAISILGYTLKKRVK